MTIKIKSDNVKEIIRNVNVGVRTKSELKRCGCDDCISALEELKK
jgi:hypothetical protein